MAILAALTIALAAVAFLQDNGTRCATSSRTETQESIAAKAPSASSRSSVSDKTCNPTLPYLPIALSVLSALLLAPWILGLMPGHTSVEAFGTKLTHSDARPLAATALVELGAMRQRLAEKLDSG